MSKELSPLDATEAILVKSYKIFKNNFIQSILIYLPVAILSIVMRNVLLEALFGTISPGGDFVLENRPEFDASAAGQILVSSFVFMVAATITFNGYVKTIVAYMKKGKKITFEDTFKHSLEGYWRMMIVITAFVAALYAGLFALVIPALIIGVLFFLAPLVVVIEKKKTLESFKRSKDLVVGQLPLLGVFSLVFISAFVLLTMLTAELPLAIGDTLSLVILPFETIIYVAFYAYLAKEKDA